MDWLCLAALLLSCVLGHAVGLAEAGSLNSKLKAHQNDAIEPELEPTSDKKFFGKKGDYASDDRPKATGLHFDHPYPHVQDTSDYDKDFVKDENGDNGAWQAQTEYDRLRQKLRKEKQDVADALGRKIQEEEALRRAAKRQQEAEEEANKAKIAADKIEIDDKTVKPKVVDVATASDSTETAMDNLKDCKEELEEARAKLKETMDKLDVAKEKEAEAKKFLEEKEDEEFAAAKKEKDLEEKVDKEEAEHTDAKTAYEKQKEKVESMEKDLEAAQRKVAAIRDSEDANGGVYPEKARSAAPASASPLAGVALTALMALFAAPQ